MLDNPIWHSLRTRHAHIAIRQGLALRYPPAVTPFVAVASDDPCAEIDLRQIVPVGDRVGILGVLPPLGEHWRREKEITIRQFVWPDELDASPAQDIVPLGEEHIPAMLELTALVYPAYFRAETARLGDYFGVLDGERLVAMAGVRMALDGHQELSAICTHPDYRGQGHAARLSRHLVHQIRSQGDRPFLHTESFNEPAQALYRKLGFLQRTELPFHVISRTEP